MRAVRCELEHPSRNYRYIRSRTSPSWLPPCLLDSVALFRIGALDRGGNGKAAAIRFLVAGNGPPAILVLWKLTHMCTHLGAGFVITVAVTEFLA